MSLCGELTGDSDYQYIFDKMANQYGGSLGLGRIPIAFDNSWNPYATRTTEAVWLAQGKKVYNDSVRGVTILHTGYDTAADTSLMISSWKRTALDHDQNTDNIQLLRKNQWAIDSWRGYFSTLWTTANNTIAVYGALSAPGMGQLFYELGDDWVYVVSGRSGLAVYEADNPQPPEIIEELGRSYVYKRLSDNSDLVVIFDRLDTYY